MVLLAALAVMTFVGGYAQEPAKVGAVVDGLVQKYGDVKGVDCMTLVKGKGLEMVKMMFNKQFGKEFMRGVTSIPSSDIAKPRKRPLRPCARRLMPLPHCSRSSISRRIVNLPAMGISEALHQCHRTQAPCRTSSSPWRKTN